jgi:hypothetical protein
VAQYRIADLDLSTRCELGLEMLRPIRERPRGRATKLARKHNSRGHCSTDCETGYVRGCWKRLLQGSLGVSLRRREW